MTHYHFSLQKIHRNRNWFLSEIYNGEYLYLFFIQKLYGIPCKIFQRVSAFNSGFLPTEPSGASKWTSLAITLAYCKSNDTSKTLSLSLSLWSISLWALGWWIHKLMKKFLLLHKEQIVRYYPSDTPTLSQHCIFNYKFITVSVRNTCTCIRLS